MKNFTLFRYDKSAYAFFGILLSNKFMCHTLERAWKDNMPFLSCIPTGEYRVARDDKGKYKYYRLLNVEDRTDIELHPANWPYELAGCIALGDSRKHMKTKDGSVQEGVTNSKDTFLRLQSFLGDDEEFKLKIEDIQ